MLKLYFLSSVMDTLYNKQCVLYFVLQGLYKYWTVISWWWTSAEYDWWSADADI